KARKYSTSLEMALDGPNIPTSVYTRLIQGVNRNLPAFHRYLRLRQRMLGLEYASILRRAFNERWIDLLPTTGKRSGAYSNGGAYDVHPYMLINFNGKYTDVS